MSGEPVFQIDVSFRNFKFTRGYAVKDTQDAITELLTNACDAYLNIDNYQTAEKYIYINFHHVKNNETGSYDNYLSITDNATGVDPSKMKSCFLVAGNKTSNSDQARGFFSTGAKNITILGDTYFTSVKNGVFSQVYLDDEVYGHIVTHGPYDESDPTKIPDVVGLPMTNTHRQALNIPTNGMNVVLSFTNKIENSKFSSLDLINNMMSSINKIASLRDIFSNPKYVIIKDIRSDAPFLDVLNIENYTPPVIHTDNSTYNPATHSDNFGGLYRERLTYIYPPSKLLLSTTFTVPNYEQYQAKFVIYRANKPIAQPAKENQLEFGFLIKDSHSIHEVNTLGVNERYRWNPNINYLFGYVFCDGFAEELKKYDRGESDELILDPNRVGGINHSHSLYMNILTVVLPRLDKTLLDVQQESSFKSINIQELDTIVNRLEDLGVDVFNSNNVTFNFLPDKQGELAIALKRTENHIVSEMTSSINTTILNTDAIIDLIKKRYSDKSLENYIFYVNKEGEVSNIPYPAIPDIEARPIDNMEDGLHKVIDNIPDLNATMPFLFRLDKGEWTKTEIFQRGRIERSANYDNSLIKVKHKSLTIQFINDINHEERYLVDTTSGIIIKINLHNKIVADKLSKTKINELDDGLNFNISEKASYDAMHFLELLMIDAFTDIIVDNDILQGRIPMVDTGSNAAMKIMDHWTKVSNKIEPTIHALFMEFINKKKEQMRSSVFSSVEYAKNTILEMFNSNQTTFEDVENGATRLANAIALAVSDII